MINTLLQLFWATLKIGLIAFGGGNTAIPLLEAEAVPHWVSRQEFGELVGINFAFPGVSILKLAGMIGIRAAGVPGLLVAVTGLATPGLVLTIVAYGFLNKHRDHKLIASSLLAMQYAAVALLAGSAWRMMQSVSSRGVQITGVALSAGLFLASFKLPPALIILVGALIGMWIL